MDLIQAATIPRMIIIIGSTAGAAPAQTITFDDLQHGEIVNGQLFDAHGVTVSAFNPNRDFDLAIIFDSLESDTADPDLEGPLWSGGNLPGGTMLGNMLILAENDVDSDGDGLIDSPDDEGQRPAGAITFEFDRAIDAFGLDLIDIEDLTAETGELIFSLDGEELASVSMSEFTNGDGIFLDGSIGWGNNSANRISPISAADLGITYFDAVTVALGGSGAIDNIVYASIPAPGAAAMLGLGLFLNGRRRSRD